MASEHDVDNEGSDRGGPVPLLCPATALAERRAACAELIRRDLGSDDPVFVRLDRQLDHLEALTRDGAA